MVLLFLINGLNVGVIQWVTAPSRFITRKEFMMMSEGFLSRTTWRIHRLKSPKQIRANVISWWLKNYNLRQVHYMDGHKYVSSTERYQLNNLDKLQERINKYRPLC